MSFIIYMVPVIVSIILGFLIRDTKEKRRKLYDEMHIVTHSINNFRLILGIFFVVTYIVAVIKVFIPYYSRVQTMLMPGFLEVWYELLWIEKIREINLLFFNMEMFSEVGLLMVYMDLLVRLVLGSTLLLVGIYLIFQGLQRVIICTSGVYFGGKLIGWEKIREATWEGIIVKNNRNYTTLSMVKKDSLSKGPKSFNEFTLNIIEEDGSKIEKIIKEFKSEKEII